MNIVFKEILDCITSLESVGDGMVDAKVKFSRSFSGFDGHFPDQPILPGVCMLEVIKAILFKDTVTQFFISELISVKFYNIIAANEEFNVKMELINNIIGSNSRKYKVSFFRGSMKKALFKLIVSPYE